MDDPRLLGAELDLPPFGGAHRLADIRRHRAEARVGHQSARTQDLAEPPHQRHHVWAGDGAIKIDLAGLDLLGEILGPDDVRAGRLGLFRPVAASKDGHPHRLSGAVGQHHRAPQVLIGLARIEIEVHRNFDRLVELRRGAFLDQLERVRERVRHRRINSFIGLSQPLSRFCHRPYSTTSRPIERAEPISMRYAPSRSFALRSCIFCSAISRI